MRTLITLSFIVWTGLLFAQKTDNQNGYVKYYYPNGKLSSEGYMVNGKPDRYWKTYYVSGVLKSEGNRKNFLLDSIWVFYSETADITEKISYVLGKKNGYYLRYTTVSEKNAPRRNVIFSKELFVNDKKESVGYYFYPNGTIAQTITYKNNKRHGIAREFDKQGTLITVLEYFNDYLIDKQNINRVVDGKKEGNWKEYYDNGKVKSERHYTNDQLDGYQKDYNPSGNLVLKQLYNEGKVVDLGKNDTLNIEERLVYDDQKRVIKRGYYQNNIPVGIHREYNSDGTVKNSFTYDNEGHIVSQGIVKDDGSREGKWEYYFEDGEVKSSGMYENNRQQGEWRYFFKGGTNEQIGSFNRGVLTGKWDWFYPDGKKIRTENFEKGKKTGLYAEYSKTGDTLSVGNYIDGEKNGFWKTNYGDVCEQGNYVNDLKDGVWKTFYNNGKLYYQGNYIQGNPDGKHTYYYDDGKIMEEQFYANGIKEKNWYKFSPEGQLVLAITYQSDEEVRINGYKVDTGKKAAKFSLNWQ